MVWFITTIISLFSLTVFLSIPSFISLYKIGYKNYINNIKFLYHNYKNIKDCYRLKKETNYSFRYQDGSVVNSKRVDTYYYYPIIGNNLVYVIDINSIDGYNLFYNFNIAEYKKINDSWTFNEFKVKNIQCILTMLLHDRFLRKLQLVVADATDITDIDDLNRIINSDIKTSEREKKLKFILNE